MTITLTANDPDVTSVALLDGTGTDTLKLVAADWGDAAWSTSYSGPRGTYGARAASSTPGNRSVSLTFTTTGAASFTAAAGVASSIANVVELTRRHGGTLTVRHSNQSYRQHFRVLAGSMQSGAWTNRAARGRLAATLAFTAAPYIEGDSLTVTDGFATDTEEDYAFDRGAAGDVTTGSGRCQLDASASDVAMIHTATGYTLGDAQVTVRFVPQSIGSNHYCAAITKRTAADTFLKAEVGDDGAAGTLAIVKSVSGSQTTLASTSLSTRVSAGDPYHAVIRVEGNTVHAEYWAAGTNPSLGAAASTAVSHVLTGSDITAFGEGAQGSSGLSFYDENGTLPYAELLEVSPYVYRGGNIAGDAHHPGMFRLDGGIPGDAPAAAVIDVGVVPESTDTTSFGMVGWCRRPPTWNMVPDPSFEWVTSGVARQWTVAGVTGVTGAATSITQTTGGRYGVRCAEVVTPATANRGVACELTPPGGFRAGVTYTAEVWVRAASATTNTRLRLGVSGDIASETPAALTSGWTKRTVTWTPDAHESQAYLAFEVTAATGTTMQLDAASVYEGTTEPSIPTQRDGGGGIPPFGVIEGHAAVAITGFATSTGSGYLNNRRLHASSGTTASAEWVLDPALIPPADHTDTVDVEVWAGIENATTGLEVTASVESISTAGVGQVTYTREWGATPRTVGAVNGLLRLGTIPMVPSGDVPLPQRLVTDWEWTTAGGGLTLNYLLLMIPSQRLASPTGKSDTGYPVFANTTSGRSITRRLLPDGRGQASSSNAAVWATAPALVGPLLEPDSGDVDFVATVARHIPDTAGGAVLALWRYGALSVAVTPRWHTIRTTT